MGFKTWRERLVEQYDASGEDYIANTRGYWSSAYLTGLTDATMAPTAAGQVPSVVRFPAQAVTLFSYGVEDNVPVGKPEGFGSLAIEATEADTNVSARKSTNGAEDFCFEGLSIARRCLRWGFSSNAFGAEGPFNFLDTEFTETILTQAAGVFHDATAAGYFTGSLEAGYHQEDAVFPYLFPEVTLNAQWNRKRLELIGTGSHLAQGGGASWLRAHGLATTDNRLAIPEGYIWRRDGQTDSDLAVVMRLEDDVAIGYGVPAIQTAAGPPAVFAATAPDFILAGVQVRLHGISFDYPSGN